MSAASLVPIPEKDIGIISNSDIIGRTESMKMKESSIPKEDEIKYR